MYITIATEIYRFWAGMYTPHYKKCVDVCVGGYGQFDLYVETSFNTPGTLQSWIAGVLVIKLF